MSKPNPSPSPTPLPRCPHCDSVVDPQARRCLMCGGSLTPVAEPEVETTIPEPEREPEQPSVEPAEMVEEAVAEMAPEPQESQETQETQELETVEAVETETAEPEPDPALFKTAVPVAERIQKLPPIHRPQEATHGRGERWRPNFALFVGLLFIIVLSVCGGVAAWQAERTLAVPTPFPTRDTAVADLRQTITPTFTLTPTPDITATPTATTTPAPTETPFPTDTPQPDRFHQVETGESLIGISLRYGGITIDSIAEANSLDLNNPLIQVGQNIIIPWPSPTPPLQAIMVEVGEDRVLVDPANCPPFYEISEGDTLFQLAASNRVPLDALLQINYLTIDSVLQPGDVICIPQVQVGGILPPTPGPSPTPSLTPPPAGPRLLYPAQGTTVADPAGVVALQWLVVQDLAPDEYYMVEVTDLTAVDSHPRRAFTRQTSFQIPADWRADEDALHEFRWRVSIVRVTGQRADGSFIYTYGGRASQDGSFFWLGAVPTPTPTFTPTPTNTPTAVPTPVE